MTPSEMADELVGESLALKLAAENGEVYRQPVYEKAFASYRLMRSAARTIREIDGKRCAEIESHGDTFEKYRSTSEALKIAREALESVAEMSPSVCETSLAHDMAQIANEALAHIK